MSDSDRVRRLDAEAPLSRAIEHTLLVATATRVMVDRLCAEARTHNLFGVCVNPCYVTRAAGLLADTDVRVITVVGFPLGASTTKAKAFECAQAVADGAHEIDMVVNLGALKAADRFIVRDDMAAVVAAADGRPVKVILETSVLTDGEKVLACQLAASAGASFVKTSTGFAQGGATLEDVSLLRNAVGNALGVKASGGIRDAAFARALMAAGADRLGTSCGAQIAAEDLASRIA
jgi:deoxyribose-phosphate aldolase